MGQPATYATDPSLATSRAGNARASSHAGAAAPRTMAAVACGICRDAIRGRRPSRFATDRRTAGRFGDRSGDEESARCGASGEQSCSTLPARPAGSRLRARRRRDGACCPRSAEFAIHREAADPSTRMSPPIETSTPAFAGRRSAAARPPSRRSALCRSSQGPLRTARHSHEAKVHIELDGLPARDGLEAHRQRPAVVSPRISGSRGRSRSCSRLGRRSDPPARRSRRAALSATSTALANSSLIAIRRPGDRLTSCARVVAKARERPIGCIDRGCNNDARRLGVSVRDDDVNRRPYLAPVGRPDSHQEPPLETWLRLRWTVGGVTGCVW